MNAPALYPTDASLIDRLVAGDGDALGPLYRKYGADVRGLLLRVEPTMTREDADDLGQEVFLTFLDTVGRYEEQGRLKSWLYGIAVRKARGWRRRTWLRRTLRRAGGAEAAAVSLAEARTEERVAAKRYIEAALSGLPASQREVLVLTAAEGMSAREAAAVLGISENAVATRLFRARKAMSAGMDAAGGQR